MTLKDISNGPEWGGWIACGILFLCAVILLSGKGGFLIAGYNTASKETKAKYDEKVLCRIVGTGMMIIAIATAVLLLGQDVLPASAAGIYAGIVGVDVVVMLILMATKGKKKT